MAQYELGRIYYENIHVPRDINKSIFYLTLAAENENNNISKIHFYLGVVYYCNQYIPKDIKKAIHYSRFNLAKIFYFGIDVDRNISKSIELLENVSDKNNLPAYLLLFYIYFLSDDENIKNIQKAEFYLNLIMNLCFDIDFYMLVFNIYHNDDDNNNIIIIRFIEFIKEYDLIYLFDDSFESDFINFLNTGSFHQPEKSTQDMNAKNKRENITEDFYRGFYNV